MCAKSIHISKNIDRRSKFTSIQFLQYIGVQYREKNHNNSKPVFSSSTFSKNIIINSKSVYIFHTLLRYNMWKNIKYFSFRSQYFFNIPSNYNNECLKVYIEIYLLFSKRKRRFLLFEEEENVVQNIFSFIIKSMEIMFSQICFHITYFSGRPEQLEYNLLPHLFLIQNILLFIWSIYLPSIIGWSREYLPIVYM